MSEHKSGAVSSEYHIAVIEKKDRELSTLKAQRDELLAALQMALADHMTEVYLHPLRDGTVEAIRCAIANAEERGLDAGDKSL